MMSRRIRYILVIIFSLSCIIPNYAAAPLFLAAIYGAIKSGCAWVVATAVSIAPAAGTTLTVQETATIIGGTLVAADQLINRRDNKQALKDAMNMYGKGSGKTNPNSATANNTAAAPAPAEAAPANQTPSPTQNTPAPAQPVAPAPNNANPQSTGQSNATQLQDLLRPKTNLLQKVESVVIQETSKKSDNAATISVSKIFADLRNKTNENGLFSLQGGGKGNTSAQTNAQAPVAPANSGAVSSDQSAQTATPPADQNNTQTQTVPTPGQAAPVETPVTAIPEPANPAAAGTASQAQPNDAVKTASQPNALVLNKKKKTIFEASDVLHSANSPTNTDENVLKANKANKNNNQASIDANKQGRANSHTSVDISITEQVPSEKQKLDSVMLPVSDEAAKLAALGKLDPWEFNRRIMGPGYNDGLEELRKATEAGNKKAAEKRRLEAEEKQKKIDDQNAAQARKLARKAAKLKRKADKATQRQKDKDDKAAKKALKKSKNVPQENYSQESLSQAKANTDKNTADESVTTAINQAPAKPADVVKPVDQIKAADPQPIPVDAAPKVELPVASQPAAPALPLQPTDPVVQNVPAGIPQAAVPQLEQPAVPIQPHNPLAVPEAQQAVPLVAPALQNVPAKPVEHNKVPQPQRLPGNFDEQERSSGGLAPFVAAWIAQENNAKLGLVEQANDSQGQRGSTNAVDKLRQEPAGSGEQDPDDEENPKKLAKKAVAIKGAQKTTEEVDKITWVQHRHKHVPSKNKSWKEIVRETKNGPAKYKQEICHPNTDVQLQKFEREAWEKGITYKKDGSTEMKILKFDEIIGAKDGIETQFMRIEKSANSLHAHPITPAQYFKYLKLVKK